MFTSRSRLAFLFVFLAIIVGLVATLLRHRQLAQKRSDVLDELRAMSITGTRPGTPNWLDGWISQEEGYKVFGEELTMVNFTKAPSDELLERMTVFGTIERIAFTKDKELTSNSLKHVARLRNLKHIWFEGPDFPTGGFAPLKDLTALQTLVFSELEATDEELQQLSILPNLKSIEFSNSKVSVEAVVALRQALPGCEINLAQQQKRLRRSVSSSEPLVRTPLSPDEQQQFLSNRIQSGLYSASGPLGSFRNYALLLKAAHNLVLHTEIQAINDTDLTPVLVRGYVPTVRELLDVIARQTKSHWEYDADRDYWVFSKPPVELPFRLTLAKEWKQEDRGVYVLFESPDGQASVEV